MARRCRCCSTVIISGCVCAMPTTLQLTADPNPSSNFWIQTAHLTYRTIPSDLYDADVAYTVAFGGTPPDPATKALVSDSRYTDNNGDDFYFTVGCDSTFGYVVLGRSYLTVGSIQAHGGDSISYRWLPGFNGNTCNPFSLVRGSVPGRTTTDTQASLVGPA